MVEPVLEIKNLTVEFHTHEGVVRAVNDLSYTVMPGETIGIVGESGSGKSVSSMAVMDLLPKPPAVIGKNSSIKVLGKEVVGLGAAEMQDLRGNVMSMIFQDPMTCLNPYRRVDIQMIEGLLYHKRISKKEALKKAQAMLEFVQIPEAAMRLRAYPHELSGGMRQRVMIAMALTCDPKLIFADEPTTALDVTVQSQIMKLFQKIQEEFHTAIVLISHNLGVIATQCDNIMVMYAGQAMEYGSPEDIFERSIHPYTVALRRSIPELYPTENEHQRLETIKGNPPNLMKLGAGFQSKYTVTCKLNHQWKVTANHLQNGRWCPECKKETLRRVNTVHTIEEMKEFARKKGGECLSTEYRSFSSPLKWKCSEGHVWVTNTSNVVFQNKWCKICARQRVGNLQRGTIEKYQAIARVKNGDCLSLSYTNAKTKMTWRCFDGHIWEAPADSIQSGRWCMKCRRKQ